MFSPLASALARTKHLRLECLVHRSEHPWIGSVGDREHILARETHLHVLNLPAMERLDDLVELLVDTLELLLSH